MKTRWYPAAINPARKGWYECIYSGISLLPTMRYYNGSNWLQDPEGTPGMCLFGEPDDKWRGLTEAGRAQARRKAQ